MDYVTSLISARLAGVVSDHIHLGLFTEQTGQIPLDRAQEAMSLHHMSHLDVQAGQALVDIGCGFGGTLRLIDSAFADMELHGVNIDPRQLDLARKVRFRNRVNFHASDAASFLTARLEWIDRILSLEALFHFPDPTAFFESAAAALRPSGRVVVSTLLPRAASPAAKHAREVVTKGFGPWPFPETTLDDLARMARAAGLREIWTENMAPFCLPGLAHMSPPCPKNLTDNPVVELRRLFEMDSIDYPLLVLVKPER